MVVKNLFVLVLWAKVAQAEIGKSLMKILCHRLRADDVKKVRWNYSPATEIIP